MLTFFIATQKQVLNAYSLVEPGRVTVRNRVVKYLIPSDELFKEPTCKWATVMV